MLFHSGVFIFGFLPIVFFGYAFAQRIGGAVTLGWLLLSSAFFYGWWNPAFLILIIVSVLFNFTIGRQLQLRPKRWLLIAGIAANLVALGYFKYRGFFAEILASLTASDYHIAALVLPLGISFFSFQQISYLIDAYNGRAKPNTLPEYALFVMFFPHLIAGPIVHHAEILPQIVKLKKPNILMRSDVTVGLMLFMAGLIKKAVFADHLDLYSTPLFAAAEAPTNAISFFEAWTGALTYTLQIYFDFSGYTDMAIGLARMFSIHFPVNFDSPFKAKSIIDFWQRWHITMTRFFMGYVYNPIVTHITRKRAERGLPTSQKMLSKPGLFLMLLAWPTMLTMFLVGLWHGAAWNFMFFGLLNGVYLLINHAFRIWKIKRGHKTENANPVVTILSWAITFIAVMVGFVIFRAERMHGGINILLGMTGLEGRLIIPPAYAPVLKSFSHVFDHIPFAPLPYFPGKEALVWAGVLMFVVLAMPSTQNVMARITGWLNCCSAAFTNHEEELAWSAVLFFALGLALMAIMPFFSHVDLQPFIYFQF